MIKIIADSTCDLPDGMYEQYNVTMVPLKVQMEGVSYNDKSEITTPDLFKLIKQYQKMSTTSAPAPMQYLSLFNEAAEKGDSVICFTCSSKLSGSYQSACVAADMCQGKIDVIDTRTAALGSGLPVLDAARMVQDGKSHEEIVEYCRKRVRGMRTLIVLDTMEYLRLGSRISALTARVGGILNIKPIINVLKDGTNTVIHRAMSYTKGVEWMFNYVMETAVDLKNQIVGVGYSTSQKVSNQIVQRLQDLGVKEVLTAGIGSVVGTHIGPNAVGMFWMDM